MQSSSVIKLNNFRIRSKIMLLEYDLCLVKPKSNSTFSLDIDDWQYFQPTVPNVLKKYYNKGYCLIVLTNQSKVWKITQINDVLKSFKLPILAVIATDKNYYKPHPAIFKFAINNRKWNKNKSFMVSNTLGRINNISDMDYEFAKIIGITVKSPEHVFPFANSKISNYRMKIQPYKKQEIIIMVGFAASGKSTIINNIFGSSPQYIIISGDIHKTSAKMIKHARLHLDMRKSVIFDATNPTKAKRFEYISLAKEYKLPVRCIYVSTSMEESLYRNNQRPKDKIIPLIAYYVYRKKFEPPIQSEGFKLIKI